MRRHARLKQRLPHLRVYLGQKLPNIMSDQISHQMMNHHVSAFYSVGRLLELFEAMLNTEREQYIAETQMKIEKSLENKRDIISAAEKDIAKGEKLLAAKSDQHVRRRVTLRRLQMNAETQKWKHTRIQEGVSEEITHLQDGLKRRRPRLEALAEELNEMNQILCEMKGVVRHKIDHFKTLCSKTKKEMISHVESPEERIIRSLKQKLHEEKKKTEEYRQHLQALLSLAKTNQKRDESQSQVSIQEGQCL